MMLNLDMSLAPCLACLLRRMLPTVDRRLLVEAFRQLRVLMIPAEARELDIVIAILEDPDQETRSAESPKVFVRDSRAKLVSFPDRDPTASLPVENDSRHAGLEPTTRSAGRSESRSPVPGADTRRAVTFRRFATRCYRDRGAAWVASDARFRPPNRLGCGSERQLGSRGPRECTSLPGNELIAIARATPRQTPCLVARPAHAAARIGLPLVLRAVRGNGRADEFPISCAAFFAAHSGRARDLRHLRTDRLGFAKSTGAFGRCTLAP